MPYSTVSSARKAIPSLKKLSTAQVRQFIKVFNALVADNMDESKAIPIAISRAKKINKSMDELNKATENDKRNIIYKAVSKKFSEVEENGYVEAYAYLVDYDDEYVYWEIREDCEYTCYKSAYTYNGTSAELSDEAIEVVRTTEYLDVVGGESTIVSDNSNVHPYATPFASRVESDMEKAMKKVGSETLSASAYAYVPDPEKPSTWKLRIDDATHTRAAVAALGKGFRGQKVQIPSKDLPSVKRKVKAAYSKFFPDNEIPSILKSMEDESLASKILSTIEGYFGKNSEELPIIKQFQEDQMIAIEPLYIAIGDVDGVGDTYASPEVCYEMVKSFNQAIADGKMKGNYFHKVMTDDFSPVKAWINEVDCMIGETEVKEGMPLVKVQYNSEKAWELRKSGDFMGVSIGARATWEEVDE